VRATCSDWRFSRKRSAAWQPRRTASDARRTPEQLSGSMRPMKGVRPGGRLAGSSTARTMPDSTTAKSEAELVQGPAGMAGARAGGSIICGRHAHWTSKTSACAPSIRSPAPMRSPRRHARHCRGSLRTTAGGKSWLRSRAQDRKSGARRLDRRGAARGRTLRS